MIDGLKLEESYESELMPVDFKEIFSVEGNILSILMNQIYILDFASIYKAIIQEIDPSLVKSIDFVKNRLD